MKIRDKHVVVTGASRGVGRDIAEVMAERGARLSLVARTPQTLKEAADQIGRGAVALPTDLGDPEQVSRVLPAAEAAHGRVDILVNNAALGMSGPLIDRTAAELRSVFHTNLLSPLELARSVLPAMVVRDSGTVVNVSSFSSEVALRSFIPYSASKAGLTHGTRGLQRELAGTGVTIMLVLLGVIDTDLIHETDSDPIASGVVKRFALMPDLPSRHVAEKIADGVERGRRTLALPWVGAPMHYLRMIPTFVMDQMLRSLPSSATTIREAAARHRPDTLP